jgi:hypothetical protein
MLGYIKDLQPGTKLRAKQSGAMAEVLLAPDAFDTVVVLDTDGRRRVRSVQDIESVFDIVRPRPTMKKQDYRPFRWLTERGDGLYKDYQINRGHVTDAAVKIDMRTAEHRWVDDNSVLTHDEVEAIWGN